MKNDEVTMTLLHAILNNQQLISGALKDIANWIEGQNSQLVALSIYESIKKVEENRLLIGSCIAKIASPQ